MSFCHSEFHSLSHFLSHLFLLCFSFSSNLSVSFSLNLSFSSNFSLLSYIPLCVPSLLDDYSFCLSLFVFMCVDVCLLSAFSLLLNLFFPKYFVSIISFSSLSASLSLSLCIWLYLLYLWIYLPTHLHWSMYGMLSYVTMKKVIKPICR